jgi:hypothetical protein
MKQLFIVIEHHWATAWVIGIALLMIVDACKGNEPVPLFWRRKKPLMMIALVRISFCLAVLFWR